MFQRSIFSWERRQMRPVLRKESLDLILQARARPIVREPLIKTFTDMCAELIRSNQVTA